MELSRGGGLSCLIKRAVKFILTPFIGFRYPSETWHGGINEFFLAELVTQYDTEIKDFE